MSNITLSSNASGTATFNIASPATNTNRTLTLPDATTELVGTDATQTLTNKTIQGGAITRGTAVNTTSGTSVDFTGIPSWATRITVMANGVSTNGTSALVIQIGTGGTPDTSGYIAVRADINASNAASGGSIQGGGFRAADITAATDVVYSVTTLVKLSENVWMSTGTYLIDATTDRSGYVTGSKTLSGTLDIVRVTPANGTDTFDAGTINIMWEG